MPRLSGCTVCLSDNSGSAWGTISTTYGSELVYADVINRFWDDVDARQ